MAKRKWFILAFTTVALIWGGLIIALKIVQKDLNRHVLAVDLPHLASMQQYIGDAPAFSFLDQDRKPVTDKDLRGHVWIADFFYSQCTSACPVLTSKLVLLQKQLRSPNIRFISFSVDPEHDSPEVLKAYAKLWEGDESRWRLLSTDPNGLSAVAAGMKVAVAPSGDKDNPILHASQFMLIDTDGKIVGLYDSIDNASLAQLVEQAKLLDGESTASVPTILATGATAIERGHSLFGSMGCVACHSQVRIAPPLQSLYGSMVRLDNRKMVWADEAYLHESIVDPNAKIVAGYTRTMPTYRSYLNDSQVMDLVAYIKSLSSNIPGGHGIVTASTQPDGPELLIDPVCKMQVTADPTAPHATSNGTTYFFCSDHCRETFLKTPAKYTQNRSANR